MERMLPVGQDFVSLREAMDQLLAESFTPFRSTRATNGTTRSARPVPLEVYATPEEVVVIAAVPGVQPENIELSINQGTLVLSGTVGNVAESEEAKQATWYLHELWSGAFQRTVSLPFEVDATKTVATFEQGLLRIRLPKSEQAKPRKIAIQAGGGAQAISATASVRGGNPDTRR